MKKSIIMRGVFGVAVGIALAFLIPLGISLAIGDGEFHPVVPQWQVVCGTQLHAVLWQTVVTGIYGGVMGVSSLLLEVERWSLLRQTLTHFVVLVGTTIPVAYLLFWMPHSVQGLLQYLGIFVAIYGCIWISVYCGIRQKVRKMNESLPQ